MPNPLPLDEQALKSAAERYAVAMGDKPELQDRYAPVCRLAIEGYLASLPTPAVTGEGAMELWVDDSKPEPTGCAVARTYDDALRMLRRFRYTRLYLDHDLGEARTGYDLLIQAQREGICPPIVECISWNPVGRARIEAALSAPRHVEGEARHE